MLKVQGYLLGTEPHWKSLRNASRKYLITNNYTSLPSHSSSLSAPCRATWCASWTATCWSAWRTRTGTTSCRSASNASSLTRCTSSSKPLRDRWVPAALRLKVLLHSVTKVCRGLAVIQAHTHTHTHTLARCCCYIVCQNKYQDVNCCFIRDCWISCDP